jgi:Fur family peroxide stress response transcriptional regulator
MDYSNEEVIDYLKKHHIRPSNIRMKVLKFLLKNRIHPTVEDIYKNLIEEIPTLSKTSVYNTLNLFLEKGIVVGIALDQKELRYDINTNFHGHFKCNKCGIIYDFPIMISFPNKDMLEGFVITNRDVFFYGICKECNN